MKTNNIEHSHYLILRIHPSLAGGQSELGTLLAFALTAPCLGGELELANLQEMHFVRSIGEPERAQRRIGGSERKVLADARAAMHLYRPICNEACDPRRHHLDHADGLARRLVAHSVHQVRRAQCEQPRLLDLDPALRSLSTHAVLFGEAGPKGGSRGGARTEEREAALS